MEAISGKIGTTFVASNGTVAAVSLDAGNGLTFDPKTVTFAATPTNADMMSILINEMPLSLAPGDTLVPFDTFAREIEIDFGPGRRDDEFEVEGGFALGPLSGGIDPLAEEVTLKVGTFTTMIPAGSFEFTNSGPLGEFEFEGVIDGVTLEVEIRPLSDGSFEFEASGEDAELSGTENPVTLGLLIGDDYGITAVIAEFK